MIERGVFISNINPGDPGLLVPQKLFFTQNLLQFNKQISFQVRKKIRMTIGRRILDACNPFMQSLLALMNVTKMIFTP